MQRVLVVPWSIAAAYFAMSSPRLSAGVERVERQGAQDAADDRSDDRDPRIAPVRRALARDRQDRVHDARTEITRRIDRITGRTTEREPDRQHQQTDQQPTQP